ncbi:MAG: polymorphic toxin-type HINT domain-containing protein [Gemmataceae bacterium]
MQQFLHIPQPSSQSPPVRSGAGGDPFVAWVDNMLANNGQPLTAGSAPLYGNGNQTVYQSVATGVPEAMQAAWTSVQITAQAAAEVIAMFNPCGLVAKGLSAYSLYENVSDMVQNGFTWSNVTGAALSLLGLFGACFTGDMLVDAEGGKKRADEIHAGDKVWSRNEFDPDGPLALKEVQEVFVRVSLVLNVRVAGQVIRTTGEHPFWVENRGRWLPARELNVGDLLRTRSDTLVPVEAVDDSGKVETVYNWRIADYHTYFVSATEEGISVWAHNAYIMNQKLQGTLGALGKRVVQLASIDPGRRGVLAIVRALTKEGSIVDIVVSSSKRVVSPAVRSALAGNEIPILGALKHAETSGLLYALRQGWQPIEAAASIPICPGCANWMRRLGAIPVSPLR